MNEWARLVDRYGNELKKFELVCAFCGQHLSEHNLNCDCQENHSEVLRGRASVSQNSLNQGSEIGQSMYYTEQEPPVELIGKKRHWFGKPNAKGGAQPASSSQNQDIRVSQSGENSDALNKIRGLKSILENNLRNADFQQNGQVAKDDFINIVFESTKEYL